MADREGFELALTPVVISQIEVRILEGCSEAVVLVLINVGAPFPYKTANTVRRRCYA